MINPVLVVIPYLASAAQGRELEYAIAGWTKHFKCHHKIVIVGEGLHAIPEWIRTHEDVTLVESPRVPAISGQYRQHLDYVSCLRKVRDRFPQEEGFIMVADDCYAINDFDMSDVLFLKAKSWDIDYDPNTPNTWRQDALKTANVLFDGGFPTHDYTTHLPTWFEWDKLEMLWNRYQMDRESYVMEDLYFNTFFYDRIPFLLDETKDNLKLSVNQNGPGGTYLDWALRRKIWINNNPDGWRPELEALLKRHYGMD